MASPTHRRALAAVAALLVGGALATACGSRSAPGGATITLGDFRVAPTRMDVRAGTTVTWTNAGHTEHSVASRRFFSKALDPHDRYRHRFPRAGTYKFLCTLHPQTMRGTLVVLPRR